MSDLSRPIARKQFYEDFPPKGISTGDIWLNLPTFGSLPPSHLTGIVVTPACDLTWCKSSVVTYLPIVKQSELFRYTDAFHSPIRKKLEKLASCLGIAGDPKMLFPAFGVPKRRILDQFLSEAKNLQAPDKTALRQFNDLLKLISQIVFGDEEHKKPSPSVFMSPSDYRKELEKIVRNAFSTDLHFLPESAPIGNEAGFLPEPSIVLFRHPTTIPVPIFRLAEETSSDDWDGAIESELPFTGLSSTMFPVRPMKILRLKEPFLHDLIARYTALYARLGSPDFSEDTVNSFAKDLSAS